MNDQSRSGRKNTQADYIKTALRLPQDLHSQLHQSAERTGRSLNAEIVSRLERSFSTTEMGIGGDPLDLVGFLSMSLSLLINEGLPPEKKEEIKVLASQITTKLGSRLLLGKESDGHMFITETSASKKPAKKKT